MTHKLASTENFDIVRGNQTVRVPFDATDPESAETNTLARTKDIPDLHYALVTPELASTYSVPDSWFPITFNYDGTTFTVPLADKDKLALVGGMTNTSLNYREADDEITIAVFTDGVFKGSVSNISSLAFNGGAPVVGETALDAVSIAPLVDRACNAVAGAATLTLPAATPYRARDLVVDVDNSAGASGIGLELASDATAYLDVEGAPFFVAVADGNNLADLLTVAAGTRARLYFTETAQTATPTGGTAVPVISLQRSTIVVGGAA